MKLKRRELIAAGVAAGALALGGGGAWYLMREEEPKGTASRIDLLGYATSSELPIRVDALTHLVMLTVTGGTVKNSRFEARILSPDGEPISLDSAPAATLENLITGERTDFEVSPAESPGVYTLEQNEIRSDGWWQVKISVGKSEAMFPLLMPDPNLAGFGAPPVVESDPQASAMLVASLNVLSNNTSLRWWEWLSGGNGSLIMAIFSVTTPESNGLPPSFENESLLAGRVPPEGGPASFRDQNPHTITIGEQGLRRLDQGTPGPYAATSYLPIAEYATTYAGHDSVHLGVRRDIRGMPCQLVSFHLPGLQEAWFAFWVNEDTLQVEELYMVSTYHYMHWMYFDVNEPFEIAFPD